MAKRTVTIDTCDYPECERDRGLATCSFCGMLVCEAHRFEGQLKSKQAFLCWMHLPPPKV